VAEHPETDAAFVIDISPLELAFIPTAGGFDHVAASGETAAGDDRYGRRTPRPALMPAHFEPAVAEGESISDSPWTESSDGRARAADLRIFEKLHERTPPKWVEPQVRIGVNDDVAARVRRSEIPGPSHSEILHAVEFYAPAPQCYEVRGAVCGAVVDNN